jgi:hypothetical protein
MPLALIDVPDTSVWSKRGDRGAHFMVRFYWKRKRVFVVDCSDGHTRLMKLGEIEANYDRWYQMENWLDGSPSMPV